MIIFLLMNAILLLNGGKTMQLLVEIDLTGQGIKKTEVFRSFGYVVKW